MSARLISSIAELRERLEAARASRALIGLAPTMGALHAGHGRLIEQARRETDLVVVSIFVNPIQFNQAEDYNRYPRTLSDDVAFCSERGVDIVFAPPEEEMYRRVQRTFVEVPHLSQHLCGHFRPGHFRGVATVVLKLLNIVQPDRAYFGEKDAQQLAVIRRLVEDLNAPVSIVAVPTVREPDGLALSSRNRLLTPEQRRLAPALYRALRAAASLIARGERDAEKVKSAAREALAPLTFEYIEIVDPEEMQPADPIAVPVLVAAAAWLGSVRLIDNVLCPGPSVSP